MTHYLNGFVPDVECPRCHGNGWSPYNGCNTGIAHMLSKPHNQAYETIGILHPHTQHSGH